jgi:glucan phosphoethanolaminetransferase (alkaline phosphatase superfamily)
VNERTALTENVVRYGTAALACFTIAVITYVVVVVTHLSAATTQQVAALGVAWWLVGCGLVPLTAYWAWRRSVFDRSSE